uniref:Uncharacterized protein n=1 Tax=Euplotes harpa TaxID=151035 RepID=A0A7S3J8R6_9SPIT|mmetsp:Transcript_21571/g.24804  ORF Transcript_21571/g.24804 Transcript_21571/m.24804 type:complete len:311 (+) Transcript_21571:1-933(+)
MKIGFALVLLIIGGVFSHDHPMVGVISYPFQANPNGITSYIQGESAKFVEASGSRNVAIPFDQVWQTSVTALENLNGIYIQNSFFGEYSNSEVYKQTLKNAYTYTTDENDKKVVFPLWASGISALQLCEVLSTTQNLSAFTTSIDAMDYVTKLNLKEQRYPKEKIALTGLIKDNFIKYAIDENIAYFNQNIGLTEQSLKADNYLNKNFEIVATAKDRNGVEFVAILKSREYPIFLSFVLFESVYNFFPSTNVPHSSHATRLTVQFSKVFVGYARENSKAFATRELEYENNLFNLPMKTVATKEYMTFYLP